MYPKKEGFWHIQCLMQIKSYHIITQLATSSASIFGYTHIDRTSILQLTAVPSCKPNSFQMLSIADSQAEELVRQAETHGIAELTGRGNGISTEVLEEACSKLETLAMEPEELVPELLDQELDATPVSRSPWSYGLGSPDYITHRATEPFELINWSISTPHLPSLLNAHLCLLHRSHWYCIIRAMRSKLYTSTEASCTLVRRLCLTIEHYWPHTWSPGTTTDPQRVTGWEASINWPLTALCRQMS